MFLAYKLFEIAQLCRRPGVEHPLHKARQQRLPGGARPGIPASLAAEWEEYLAPCLRSLPRNCEALEHAACENPPSCALPPAPTQRSRTGSGRNFALDRSRYLIPFATRTNVALVMTARAWAETVKQLDSLPLPEAHACAAGVRGELAQVRAAAHPPQLPGRGEPLPGNGAARCGGIAHRQERRAG